MAKKDNRKSFLSRLKRFFLYLNRRYDSLQKDEIILGKDKKLPVYFYKKSDFNWMQMREVRLGLEKKLDVSCYAKANMNVEQMEEIRLGLEKNLDVSFYNKKDFDWIQMREVRLGLEKKLDVSYYANPDINTEEMEEIRLGLEKNLDVSYYNKKDFNWMQMREVRLGLERNLDTSFYDESKLNWKQMREIRLGMEQGVNIYDYMASTNSWKKMKNIRLNQLKEKFAETDPTTSYFKSEIREESKKSKVKSQIESQDIQEKGVDIKLTQNEKKQVKSQKIQNEDKNLDHKDNLSKRSNLSKFDANMIFPEIENNTDEKIKSNLKERYNSSEEAEKNFDIYKKRIPKLISKGYVEIVDGEYRITKKAMEEAKEVNKEFEFTSFDANKVFGYILKAGGELTLKDLKGQLKNEYTDKDYINKQYKYLKKRLENNLKNGYVTKHEDAYSISNLGKQKAKEINSQTNQKVRDIEAEEELEV